MFVNYLRSRAVRKLEGEISQELAFHIEMRTRENINAGMCEEEAKASALLRFGDPDHFRNACLSVRLKHRAERIARAIRLLTWPLIAYGLLLRLDAPAEELRHISDTLIMIALLLRLFVHVRLRQATTFRLMYTTGSGLPAPDVCGAQIDGRPQLPGYSAELVSLFGHHGRPEVKSPSDDG